MRVRLAITITAGTSVVAALLLAALAIANCCFVIHELELELLFHFFSSYMLFSIQTFMISISRSSSSSSSNAIAHALLSMPWVSLSGVFLQLQTRGCTQPTEATTAQGSC